MVIITAKLQQAPNDRRIIATIELSLGSPHSMVFKRQMSVSKKAYNPPQGVTYGAKTSFKVLRIDTPKVVDAKDIALSLKPSEGDVPAQVDVPLFFNAMKAPSKISGSKDLPRPVLGVIFEDIGWNALAGYVIRLDGEAYTVAVLNNGNAPVWKHRMVALSGIGKTTNPIVSAYHETVDEVVIGIGKTAIVPVVNTISREVYNRFIRSTGIEWAEAFGMEHKEIIANSYSISSPIILNHFQTNIGLSYEPGVFENTEYSALKSITIMVPPMELDFGSTPARSLSIRDTLSKESFSNVENERNVVLLSIRSGEGLVFSEGRLVERYATFEKLVENEGIVKEEPFSPNFAAALYAIRRDLNREVLDVVNGAYHIPFKKRE